MTRKGEVSKKNKNPRNQRYLRMKNETPTIKLSIINYQLLQPWKTQTKHFGAKS